MIDEVIEDVVDNDPVLSRVVVDPVGDVGDDPPDMIVAAPAAMTHKSDNPAPTMEPVSLIFMFATPAIKPYQGPIRRLTKTSGQARLTAKRRTLR
ncbi:MAG TPA: hypothetical protein VN110_06125 [Sphingobium sp.]|nr:hypothetical protein [Sphingobium sp.]